jgi:predicted membrane protein
MSIVLPWKSLYFYKKITGMEDQNKIKEENPNDIAMWRKMEKSHRRGKIMGGILIVVVGSLFLARELGVEIPYWVFTWKTLLIGLGLTLAVKHKFMHPGWILLVAVGGAFLLCDIWPEMQIKPIIWPSLLILLGLVIIFKPRRKGLAGQRRYCRKMRGHHFRQHHEYRDFYNREEPSKEDYIESTTVFGGVKKNILSKNFKGGEVTNVFGGSELNLSQADFEGTASLEITQVFGGTKLIVPPHWEIRSEMAVSVFGSVEDKRILQSTVNTEPTKVLMLTGTTVFGGIDIRSF